MNDIISVIIPVYNVEKYLKKCLDTLINQTYKYLQILLIDDGSTDSSGVICDEYANLDERITVIHQQNGGAATAKNAGLQMANGKYLTFVDSDDYLELDAFENMLNTLIANNADVAQFSYREIFTDSSVDIIKEEDDLGVYTADEYLKRYTTDWTCGLLWDKIYNRELFDNIFFEEGHVVDDDYFTYQGVMNANKVVIDSRIYYNYRKRKSSVSYLPEHMERIIFDRLDYLLKRKEKVLSRFPSLCECFNAHYANMLIWLSSDPYLTERSIREIKKQMKVFIFSNHNQGVNLRTKIKMCSIILSKSNSLLKKKRQCDTDTMLKNFFS